MDNTVCTLQPRRLLLDSAVLVAIVAVVAFVGVYSLHGPWHGLLAMSGLPERLGEAIGTVILVVGAFIIQIVLVLFSRRVMGQGEFMRVDQRVESVNGRSLGREELAVLCRLYEADTGDWRDLMVEAGRATPEMDLQALFAARLDWLRALQISSQRAAEGLGTVGTFSAIGSAHLKGVIATTEEAAFAILEEIHDLDDMMRGMMDFVRRSDTESVEMLQHSDKQLAENQRFIDDLAAYLDRRLHDVEAERSRFMRVVEEADGLENRFEAIAQIANTTNMLALNAKIEATRAGKHGAGFAVVADEVRSLSLQAAAAVTQVQAEITRLQEVIHSHLADETEAYRVENEKEMLRALGRQLASSGQSYEQISVHQRDLIAAMDGRSRDLSSRVMRALGHVQFQDIVRQQSEALIQGLDDMNKASVTLSSMLRRHEPTDPKAIAEVVEDMERRYVMDSQRLAHAAGTHTAAGVDAAPAVELF